MITDELSRPQAAVPRRTCLVAEYTVGKGRSGDTLRMARIKTNAYRDRVEQAFAERWEDYWE